LIFASVLAYASLDFEYENKPSLYYYDAVNALDFLDNELSAKNIEIINDSIYSYLGYIEYYLEIKYYNQTGLSQSLIIGNYKKNSNYCSQKYYLINSELVNAKLCIGRDFE
jgi:hypothetical protein